MQRTLWKWAAPTVVLATVAVWGWAQESKPPVPAGATTVDSVPGGNPPANNPNRARGSSGGSDPNVLRSFDDDHQLDLGLPTRTSGSPGGNAASSGSFVDVNGFGLVDVIDSNGVRSRIRVQGSPPPGTKISQIGEVRKDYTVVQDGLSPGMAGGMPGVGAVYPGRGSGSLGVSATPIGRMRAVVTRRSVYETKMVPISEEEILEAKQFQDLLQHIGDTTQTEAEKEVGRKQLAELLEKQFNSDMETREKDVVELETRVKKLREQFDKRKAAKEKIIELRQMTILNSLEGLGFPDVSGAGGPLVSPPNGTEFPRSESVFGGSEYDDPDSFTRPVPKPRNYQPSGRVPILDKDPILDERRIPNPRPSFIPISDDSVPSERPVLDRNSDADFGGAAIKPLPPSVDFVGPDPDRPSGNLIRNPSFDHPGPNGWGTGATPASVEYTIDPKGGVNGTAAARIHKTENTYFPISEWTYRIDHDSGTTAKYIELSAMVKTKDATKAILDVMFLDDKGECFKHEWAAYIGDQSNDPQPLTHDFKEYKGTVAIPPNTKAIVIGLQDYGPGDIWFDDVSAVYKQEAPAVPNNVPRRVEPLSD